MNAGVIPGYAAKEYEHQTARHIAEISSVPAVYCRRRGTVFNHGGQYQKSRHLGFDDQHIRIAVVYPAGLFIIRLFQLPHIKKAERDPGRQHVVADIRNDAGADHGVAHGDGGARQTDTGHVKQNARPAGSQNRPAHSHNTETNAKTGAISHKSGRHYIQIRQKQYNGAGQFAKPVGIGAGPAAPDERGPVSQEQAGNRKTDLEYFRQNCRLDGFGRRHRDELSKNVGPGNR